MNVHPDVLAEMLQEAKQASDRSLIAKIKEAQKFLGCRNVQKRKTQS